MTEETQAFGEIDSNGGAGAVAADGLGSLSVDVLQLKSRIRHLLAKHHIDTLADLIGELDQLVYVRGFGKNTIAEIRQVLDNSYPDLSNIIDEKPPTLDLQPWGGQGSTDISWEIAPIEVLLLSTRTQNALLRAGVKTLGDLTAIRKRRKDVKVHNFGDKAAQELSEKLEQWIAKVPQESIRGSFGEESATLTASQRSSEKSTQLPGIKAPEILLTASESLTEMLSSLKKDWAKILQLLYGLNTGTPMTLQGVADLQCITRERVRQKKNVALRQLIPYVRYQQIFPLGSLIERIIQPQGIISNQRLIAELIPELSPAGYYPEGVLALLCDIGLENIQPHIVYLNMISAWVTGEVDIDQTLTAHQAVLGVFQEAPAPLSWTALFSILHQNPDLLALHEEYAFAIVRAMAENGYLEQQPDGTWTLPLSRKMNRQQRIIEALQNIGRSSHFKEITKTHNELFPNRSMTDHNIHAILLDHSGTFARVGRGTYGLTEWGLQSDGTLANAVWRVLNTHRRPMTFDEIKAEVLQTWQVESNSIQTAISSDSRFTRLQDGRIGLTRPGSTIKRVKKRSDKTRRERVLAILQQIGKPSDYREITDYHNRLFPDLPLTEMAVQNLMMQQKKVYVNMGGGVFGLAKWGLAPQASETGASVRRLKEVLQAVNRPLHHKEIHCVHNQLYPETPLAIGTINNHLSKNPDIFVKTGRGTFGLAEWGLTKAHKLEESTLNRLYEIFKQYSRPMHHKEIHRVHNELFPLKTLSEVTIYQTLRKHPDVFIMTDRGVYGLIEWNLDKFVTDSTTTKSRLYQILVQSMKPMHYEDIEKAYNDLDPGKPLSQGTIYNWLNTNTDVFMKTSSGKFGLVEWGLIADTSDENTASARLYEVFKQASRAMHYLEAHAIHNHKYIDDPISENRTYQVLNKNSDIFIKTGKGIFALVESSIIPKPEST